MRDISKITLYSGGHKGAEAEFGKLAEAWGINEVNFVFEGHSAERTKNLRVLTGEELKKGDVSMEIISMRMKRSYSKADKIRKVIQTIFHMVNSGYHVVTVGWIQEDGTVKGGTGWGVELARLFNRPLHVYDQDKKAWYAWKGNEWIEDIPVISSETFAGTGTRYLSEDGKEAVRDLFVRSFGPQK
ncbi:MAG: hypothetical protein JXL81_10800 [Deltaproteobacteria bacterium]|nr:hypothetical protein [Deltaproteobacteria bacterium]